MKENVGKFFEIYASDPAVRGRVEANVEAYPGSYEIREALTEFALLPVAEELGLGFTLQELRAYETRLKLERGMAKDGKYDRGEHSYWLLERGWEEPRPETEEK